MAYDETLAQAVRKALAQFKPEKKSLWWLGLYGEWKNVRGG